MNTIIIKAAAVTFMFITMTGCASQPPAALIAFANGIRGVASDIQWAKRRGRGQRYTLPPRVIGRDELMRELYPTPTVPVEQASHGYDWDDLPEPVY